MDGDLRRGVLHELFEPPQEPGFSDLLTNGGALSQFVREIPLAPRPSPLCPLPSALCPLPSALCPLPSALCPLPSDLRPPTSGSLHLLPRGRPVGNSGELLLGAACDRVLAQIREQYDCAIIDSIPVFAADDTTSLAPKMDGVLLVVRGSYAGSRTIHHAMELLYERQAKIMGLVFNRANSSSRSYEYYKYADYYHSAGRDH